MYVCRDYLPFLFFTLTTINAIRAKANTAISIGVSFSKELRDSEEEEASVGEDVMGKSEAASSGEDVVAWKEVSDGVVACREGLGAVDVSFVSGAVSSIFIGVILSIKSALVSLPTRVLYKPNWRQSHFSL